MKKIHDIPKLNRSHEKLQQKGVEGLSDLELMAILLGMAGYGVRPSYFNYRMQKNLALM